MDRALIRTPAALRCAYCHEDAEAGLKGCPGCDVLLHRDCAGMLGTCPTLGCSRRVEVRVTASRPALAVPSETIVRRAMAARSRP